MNPGSYHAAHRLVTMRLREAGVDAADRVAGWILEAVTGVRKVEALAAGDPFLADDMWRCIEALALRRAAGEPIQYVLGSAYFFGLPFLVTPDVLIPRPETERLVEIALHALEGHATPRVLDVGTGSGCIALSIKSARADAVVWGCDVSSNALRIAALNRRRLRLATAFFQADALRPGFAAAFHGVLDAVIANPPYISESERNELPKEVVHHEPELALFAHPDPLAFYRAIGREAHAVLRPRGLLILEVHEDRGGESASVVEGAGFGQVTLRRDMAGKDRFVLARKA